MKNLVLVVIIFLLCALVGYGAAVRFDRVLSPGSTSTPTLDIDGPQGKQYNVILIHVDRLDRPQPRMVSVWFVSLYFIEGAPPTLTLAQIYPTPGNPGPHQSIEGAFSLTQEGTLSPGFWKAIKTLHIQWKGYLLIDDFTVQTVMEWINGPGDFPGVIGATQNNPQESQRILVQTCESFGRLQSHGPAPFDVNDLIPAHFRSDLQMQEALSYWNLLTTSTLPIKCDVLLAP